MANIYYSHPSNRCGILRAVLSPEKVTVMLKEHSVRSAGHQFPTTHISKDDFAILQVLELEASEKLRAGFYLFDEDITQIEEEIPEMILFTDLHSFDLPVPRLY